MIRNTVFTRRVNLPKLVEHIYYRKFHHIKALNT